ncbi:hypothetical protein KDA_18680 [Dictyobacter alpinus]|uniref:Uncharacterized protein n=1 Tax=Dictyobacter alpinus TaxID=2014873 RepID=A0A402B4V0_9CHLR|nr:hypothetical protein KDA_18680 [Dictyobacter alpinus]
MDVVVYIASIGSISNTGSDFIKRDRIEFKRLRGIAFFNSNNGVTGRIGKNDL